MKKIILKTIFTIITVLVLLWLFAWGHLYVALYHPFSEDGKIARNVVEHMLEYPEEFLLDDQAQVTFNFKGDDRIHLFVTTQNRSEAQKQAIKQRIDEYMRTTYPDSKYRVSVTSLPDNDTGLHDVE